jgi:lipopolysaccharide/colanic/teichoic acid biosynthesis glycosyltransferase/glycosyltransferase involved in cell wall biosynthesis
MRNRSSLPRLCVVVASDLSVRTFLRPHLVALQEQYAVTVVVNTADDTLLERIGVAGTLQRMPIRREISVVRDLQTLAALVRFFRRERFEVVHSMTPKAGLLAMAAAWLTGVPVRLHTFTGQVWATRAGLSRAFLKLMDAAIARCATFTLTDSASQRRLLIAEHVVAVDRIAVLANGSVSGVNGARFRADAARRRSVRDREGIGDTDLVLLFVGRLTRDKGVLDLARAFTMLAAERPEVHLILVGPDEQKLRREIAARCRDCERRVHFIEFTETPEEIVAAADLVCLPSYREGFPNVILEAAAAGIPAVASDICGIVDAVEEGRTGLLHEPRDVAGLLGRLRLLAADPALRRSLGAAARARVEREFQPEALTSALIDLHARLRARAAVASGWYRRFGKRALDATLAGAALVLLLPIGMVIALVIRAGLGSPVFFRQRRPGRYGIPFDLIKFRTMADRADAAGHPLPDGERLTALGRFLRAASLDELPELWNVLRGEMSLVGPRPLLMAYLDRYTPRQAGRHDVRPGITGLAQISGRNALSWDRKFDLDLEYVECCSLSLDLRILALTVWQVVNQRGVNQPGHATAEEFMGTVGQ